MKKLFPALLLSFFSAVEKCYIFPSFFRVPVYFFSYFRLANIGRYLVGRSEVSFEVFLLFGALHRRFFKRTLLGFWAEFFLEAFSSFTVIQSSQYSGSVLGKNYKTLLQVLRTGGFACIITSSFVFVSWEYFEEGSELGRNGHVDVPMVLQQEYAISRLNFLACLDLQGVDQSASVKFLPNFYLFGTPYCTI
jgi:hypothetical protein